MAYSRFGTTDEKGRLQPPKPEPRPQKRPGERRPGSRFGFAASVLVAIAALLWAWKVASPASFSRTWDGIGRYFAAACRSSPTSPVRAPAPPVR